MRSAIFALLLLSPLAASGQITSDVVTRYEVTGLGDYEIVDGAIFVPSDASLEVNPVGWLTLEGDFDSVAILVDDVNRKPIPVEQVGDRKFIIRGSGRVWVLATMVTQDPFSIRQERFEKVIGEDDGPGPEPPGPGPGPEPGPVPDDKFDNIGRRVAGWASGMDSTAEVAACFEAASESLRNNPMVTANQVIETLTQCIKSAADYDAWKAPVIDKINVDTGQRWPMPRATLAEYYSAIATGLEAVK